MHTCTCILYTLWNKHLDQPDTRTCVDWQSCCLVTQFLLNFKRFLPFFAFSDHSPGFKSFESHICKCVLCKEKPLSSTICGTNVFIKVTELWIAHRGKHAHLRPGSGYLFSQFFLNFNVAAPCHSSLFPDPGFTSFESHICKCILHKQKPLSSTTCGTNVSSKPN